ncbi:hypothetical protein [Rhodococcus koreensis]
MDTDLALSALDYALFSRDVRSDAKAAKGLAVLTVDNVLGEEDSAGVDDELGDDAMFASRDTDWPHPTVTTVAPERMHRATRRPWLPRCNSLSDQSRKRTGCLARQE